MPHMKGKPRDMVLSPERYVAIEVNGNGRQKTYIVRFEVLTAMDMNVTALWDVTPCSLIRAYQRFGGTY